MWTIRRGFPSSSIFVRALLTSSVALSLLLAATPTRADTVVLVGLYPDPQSSSGSGGAWGGRPETPLPAVGIHVDFVPCSAAVSCQPVLTNGLLSGGVFGNVGTILPGIILPSSAPQVFEVTADTDSRFGVVATAIQSGATSFELWHQPIFADGKPTSLFGGFSFGRLLVGPSSVGSTVESLRLTVPAWDLEVIPNEQCTGCTGGRWALHGNFQVEAFGQAAEAVPVPVPEPSSLLLVAFGLIGLMGAALRKRRRA
jgi:PEP-CTERM motif-containing protein